VCASACCCWRVHSSLIPLGCHSILHHSDCDCLQPTTMMLLCDDSMPLLLLLLLLMMMIEQRADC
jgi:hypothetical protein